MAIDAISHSQNKSKIGLLNKNVYCIIFLKRKKTFYLKYDKKYLFSCCLLLTKDNEMEIKFLIFDSVKDKEAAIRPINQEITSVGTGYDEGYTFFKQKGIRETWGKEERGQLVLKSFKSLNKHV